ncbi:hypothetical protein EGW08_001498 [Elysia chlorotica]|uniref:alpha-mannosidase n=1 Tax=Elysia chlorotica TaxID=188477 RepID=A0A3S0ZZM7_ELYCH|nr:hypothetical protein EGW08_001498 [Elysia chlorotica]
MDHVPFKHKRTTLERAEKFISPHYFTDINLRSRLYRERASLTSIKHCAVQDRISLNKALQGQFKTTSIGQAFGPVWSTHWFELEVNIPVSWQGQEVHLLWDSGSEALVWVQGQPVQVGTLCSFHVVHIEMACNHLFGVGNLALVKPEDDQRTFTLKQAEIALFDRDVYDLILDVETLHDIAKELPETNQRSFQALFTVNEMINQIEVQDRSTYKRAQEIAQEFFLQRNGDSQHTLFAMGHAHIDTAWLWPYDETKRKCARSWSCTLRLMEKYPEFTFVCSQAQQFAWVKQLYPSIWSDICKFVRMGQFVPVGGTWVEMDGNIPSGEACIRQFLYGQKFFQEEFGIKCREFWLPDTFGYSAQFPQIMRHCGVSRFLTQKLSWSLVNKFPHHTFYWEGIDGSSVLTHFPPGDSYEMKGKVHELLKTIHNFRDKGRSNCSAFLFGYGDGGHGPREDMLGRLERLKDCDGLPKVKLASSDAFFSTVESEQPSRLCRWRGELYLELHNGTYTTWAKVKKYNRLCEILLQETELLCTMAWVHRSLLKSDSLDYCYPRTKLDALWKLLLLNQFHDVLPGSSINMVRACVPYYCSREQQGTSTERHSPDLEPCLVNTQPFARREVVKLAHLDSARPSPKRRKLSGADADLEEDCNETHGEFLKEIMIYLRHLNNHKPRLVLSLQEDTGPIKGMVCERYNFYLSSVLVFCAGSLHARSMCVIESYFLCTSWSNEAIDSEHPANQFLLYDDVPLYWDAWDVMDYHLETSLQISDKSYLQQKIILEAGSPFVRFDTEVTWHENRKFLKVEFPTTVHTMECAYDIQSGFLRRPNHFNTSWDSARFEVCGHKWADLSEHGFGVAVLNNSKYGYSAVDGILRLSLLRSPKTPDFKADMGVHTFSYALMPHKGSLQEAGVIQAAHSFNCPLRVVDLPSSPSDPIASQDGGSDIGRSLFELDTAKVLVQAVKMAEDSSQTIIVRLNELFGGSVVATLTSRLRFQKVQVCDGLEDFNSEDRDIDFHHKTTERGSEITVKMSAFQIISLRCCI